MQKSYYAVVRIIPCHSCQGSGLGENINTIQDGEGLLNLPCSSCDGDGEIKQRTSFDEALAYYGVKFTPPK